MLACFVFSQTSMWSSAVRYWNIVCRFLVQYNTFSNNKINLITLKSTNPAVKRLSFNRVCKLVLESCFRTMFSQGGLWPGREGSFWRAVQWRERQRQRVVCQIRQCTGEYWEMSTCQTSYVTFKGKITAKFQMRWPKNYQLLLDT